MTNRAARKKERRPSAPEDSMPQDSTADELRRLVVDLPFAYFRLKAVGDRMVARLGQSTAKWGLMRTLHDEGPHTVAQIARSRPVARQWIQHLADGLEGEGFVEFIDNPAHKRAKLMRLTAKGEKILHQMVRREAQWARRTAAAFDLRALRTTCATLRKLRDVLGRE